MSTDDLTLTSWIVRLPDRLAIGDLANLAPIDLGHGTHLLPAENTIRIMLADLADLMDLDNPARSARVDAEGRNGRRRYLFNDFHRLRELLG